MRKTALCMFMLLVTLSGKQRPSHLVRAANGFTAGISDLLSSDSPPVPFTQGCSIVALAQNSAQGKNRYNHKSITPTH